MSTVREIIEQAQRVQAGLAEAQASLAGEVAVGKLAGSGSAPHPLSEPERATLPASETLEQAWPFLALEDQGAKGDRWTHVSPSRFTMFERCPEQFKRRYVLGEKERPGAALILGSADHYAHEQNLRQKIESHEDIPLSAVREHFAVGFDKAVERGGGEDEIVWDGKPGALKDKGVEMVTAYHTTVSPKIQPIAVEQELDLHVEGIPVPIKCIVDVDTEPELIERKTGKQKRSDPKPEWRLQSRLYQAEKRKPIRFDVVTSTKTVGVYTADDVPGLRLGISDDEVQRTLEYVRRLSALMVYYLNTYGPDSPWPGALTHPWACSFCGFRGQCPWWGNG